MAKGVPMMRVPGFMWLPHQPEQVAANRPVAGTAIVTSPGGYAMLSAGDNQVELHRFCEDGACPDYNRSDFPQDRPHYHMGKRVVAPVEIKFAESKSNRK